MVVVVETEGLLTNPSNVSETIKRIADENKGTREYVKLTRSREKEDIWHIFFLVHHVCSGLLMCRPGQAKTLNLSMH